MKNSRRNDFNAFFEGVLDPKIETVWEDHIGFTSLILSTKSYHHIKIYFHFYNYTGIPPGIVSYYTFTEMMVAGVIMHTKNWPNIIKGSSSDCVAVAAGRVLEYLRTEAPVWLARKSAYNETIHQ